MICVKSTRPEVARELIIELLRRGGEEVHSVPGRLMLDGEEVVDISVLPKGDQKLQVVTSVADVRRNASHSSELVTQLIMGESVVILESRSDWNLVRLGDGYHGWIPSWSVKKRLNKEIRELEDKINAMVSSTVEPVWSEPDEGSQPIAHLVSGVRLVDSGGDDRFRHVQLANESEGYVRTQSLEPLHLQQPQRKRLTGRARRHLGVPYLWGGTTAMGFDCSGMVMRVFSMEGILLPRDSDLQSRVGSFIPAEMIMEGSGEGVGASMGDLLFYGSNGTVDHVSIYLGQGRFIHASGEVKIGSLVKGDSRYDANLADKLLFGRSILI